MRASIAKRRKISAGWMACVLILTPCLVFAEPDSLVGTWSAPSLSQPSIPIIISLEASGKATEQIGSYRGTGTWTKKEGAAWISWASGWVGLLQPLPDGEYQLLTWKDGTPQDAHPDDRQPITRTETESDK